MDVPALDLAVNPEMARGITLDIDVEPARGGFRTRDWLFALAVLGAATGAWALGMFDPGEPDPVVMPAPAADPIPVEPPPVVEAPMPEVSSVRLRNVPPDATVTVDEQPASGDSLELPKDGKPRVIRVTAPNKVAWQVVHTSTDPAVYDVWLANKTAPRAPLEPITRPRPKPKSAPNALRQLDF
jgi:hypothetical protein